MDLRFRERPARTREVTQGIPGCVGKTTPIRRDQANQCSSQWVRRVVEPCEESARLTLYEIGPSSCHVASPCSRVASGGCVSAARSAVRAYRDLRARICVPLAVDAATPGRTVFRPAGAALACRPPRGRSGGRRRRRRPVGASGDRELRGKRRRPSDGVGDARRRDPHHVRAGGGSGPAGRPRRPRRGDRTDRRRSCRMPGAGVSALGSAAWTRTRRRLPRPARTARRAAGPVETAHARGCA